MKRIESLQALRAIAFIAIFLSHCNIIATGPMGVSIFLVLSGFLLTLNYEHKQIERIGFTNSLKFTIKIIKKLYPLHLLTLFLMIMYTLFSEGIIRQMLPKIILNGLLLQAWVPSPEWYLSFNKASWYLSVCMFIYFAFLWLYSKLCKICDRGRFSIYFCGIGWIIIVVVLSSILLIMECTGFISQDFTKWITYVFPLYRCSDMFMGMMLGKIYCNSENKGKREKSKLFSALEIFLIILWFFQIILYRKGLFIPSAFRYSVFWIPSSLLTVYLFAMNEGFVTRVLTNKAIILIGNITGIAFLIHQIIIGIVEIKVDNPALITILSFVSTILISYVYQTAEEKLRSLFENKNI